MKKNKSKKLTKKLTKKPTKNEDVTVGEVQSSFQETERKETKPAYVGDFPIVGIGASAGGLEAFTQLLELLPTDTGMAYLLIQHLSPTHESLLPSILARSTQMDVMAATNDQIVYPDKVYVIPPNANMGIVNGRIKILPRMETPGRHMPADFLFRCLADDQEHLAIGIVLSGADSDGSQGLRAIRDRGGLTIVQDPKSAKVDSMPRSAIAAGGTDTILTIPEIAQELRRVSKHPYAKIERDIVRKHEDEISKVFALLKSHQGVNFAKYKRATVNRRLRRRIILSKVETITDYIKILQTDKKELAALFSDFLINVTNFFRDPEVFDALKKSVLPKLISKRESDAPIRIWVPGCSTGEEAYSLAMLFYEVMQEMSTHVPLQIFASDLSEGALAIAREGFYTESIVTDVSPERLRRFFIKRGGGYQVNPNIREVCIFAVHDVTRDPPFSRMDLVSCRNLLIYLEAPEQAKVIDLFAYSLNVKGFLVLGSAETTAASEAFDIVDKKHRIFIRKTYLARAHLNVPLTPVGITFPTRTKSVRAIAKITDAALELEDTVSKLLLDRFSPVGVVINDSAQIIQFRGVTREFLEAPSGDASLNLFRMAKYGLDTELRVMFKRVQKVKKMIQKEVTIRGTSGLRSISLEFIPLKLPSDGNFYLVLFVEVPHIVHLKKGDKKMSHRAIVAENAMIIRLKEELTANRGYLQSIIRDQDVTNEELQAAHEEVLSSNEELQSTNEELETAKEELQSSNEELSTVNDELSERNAQLVQANNDLNNFLVSASLPMIMVGNDLRIRRFTPLAEKVFNLIPGDVGRPVTDIKPNLNLPDLQKLIEDSIDLIQTKELEVQDKSGHWFSLRIRPYKTADNKIEGAVIVLIDIGSIKKSSEELSNVHMSNEVLLDNINQPVLFLDNRLKVKRVNRAYCRSFQVHRDDVLDQNFYELGEGAWDQPMLKALLNDVLPKGSQIVDFQIDQVFPRVGKRNLTINARPIQRDGATNILIIIDDGNRDNSAPDGNGK